MLYQNVCSQKVDQEMEGLRRRGRSGRSLGVVMGVVYSQDTVYDILRETMKTLHGKKSVV